MKAPYKTIFARSTTAQDERISNPQTPEDKLMQLEQLLNAKGIGDPRDSLFLRVSKLIEQHDNYKDSALQHIVEAAHLRALRRAVFSGE